MGTKDTKENVKSDEVIEKVTKYEKYINVIWGVLIRNWGKLIVLSTIAIVVWFVMLVKKEVEKGQTEEPVKKEIVVDTVYEQSKPISDSTEIVE